MAGVLTLISHKMPAAMPDKTSSAAFCSLSLPQHSANYAVVVLSRKALHPRPSPAFRDGTL